jgi:hypothetical protein
MMTVKVLTWAAAAAIGALALFAALAYAFAPNAAQAAWGWHAGHHGARHGDPCARLDGADAAEHFDRHLAGAEGWLTGTLDLDATQRAALEPMSAVIRDWTIALQRVCPLPEGDARALVATGAAVATTTAQAATRFDTAFADFYDALAPEQRSIVDAWAHAGRHR